MSKGSDIQRDAAGNSPASGSKSSDPSNRQRWEQERESTIQFSHLVNASSDIRNLLEESVAFFQRLSRCEAVAVRLREKDDFPHFQALGFSAEFLLDENSLCAKDSFGEILRDENNAVTLECYCGDVISGCFDPSLPFYTPQGSFWTNCASKLIAEGANGGPQTRRRGRCIREGYESIALIPLMTGGERLGLLRFNDRRQDRFSLEDITLWESLANHLAVALAKFRAETALRQSEERTQGLLHTISDAVIINELNPQGGVGRFVEVTDLYCQRVGYSREELLSMSPKDLDDPDLGVSAELIGAQLRENGQAIFEQMLVAKDGTRVPVIIHNCLITLRGSPCVIATVRDMSERIRSQQALLESEQRLVQAAKVANFGIFEFEHSLHAFHCSPTFRKIHGYGEEETVTRSRVLDSIFPEDRDSVYSALRQSVDPQGDGLLRIEHRIVHPDGVRWVMVQSETFFEGDGDARHPVRTVGASLDITARMDIELQLRANQQYLRTALDMAKLGVWSRDLNTNIFTCDALTRSMFGWEEHQVVTIETLLNCVIPEDRERLLENGTLTISGHNESEAALEYRIRVPDGSIRWISVRRSRVCDSAGNPSHMIGVVQDITARMDTELELRANQQYLRTALDMAKLGVWNRDLESKVITWDELTRSIFAWEEDQAVTLESLFECIVPEDRERFLEKRTGVISGQDDSEAGIEYRIRTPDGSLRWLFVRRSLLHDSIGKPTRMIGVVQDITRRKQADAERLALEEQFLHAQKMEAVGRLAGGIAHDFNNLLMVIRSYAELTEDYLPEEGGLRKNIQAIIKAADRAASLTKQMLAFSRKQVLSPVALNLNASIAEAAKMLQMLLGEDIELQLKPDESIWTVQADPDQIAQVLMNLSVNARDAMPEGGTLIIETRNFTTDEAFIAEHPYVRPGDYAVFSVADSGTGISKEVQQHMFEPFFTTKSVGKGTGLGLSTVYGVVKQSGGYLIADSDLGRGACFSIYLPRVQDAVLGAAMQKAEWLERGAGTLLVVEDETALRDSIREFLCSLGYTVLDADSGPQALTIANAFEQHIDLMITDLVMPRMSGRELSQLLANSRPQMRTIFMSGYTEDAAVRLGVQEDGFAFLQKPFSLAVLARKVREMLGSPQRFRQK